MTSEWITSAQGQMWVAYQRGSQLLERTIDQRLRETADLSHPEFEILSRLAAAPGRRMRMGSLADLLIAPKSRLNYQIGQLQIRGLVTRERDLHDGRGLNAVLTAPGLDQFEHALPVILSTIQTHVITQLGPDEQAQLGSIMTRIAQSISGTDASAG